MSPQSIRVLERLNHKKAGIVHGRWQSKRTLDGIQLRGTPSKPSHINAVLLFWGWGGVYARPWELMGGPTGRENVQRMPEDYELIGEWR